MTLALRVVFIAICVGFILFSIERFWLPFERMQLYGIWLTLPEQSPSSKATDSPVNHRHIDDRAKQKLTQAQALSLATMLKGSKPNTLSQSIALDLSQLATQHPEIKKQLLLLSQNHPDVLVRCQLENQLASGVSITLTTGEGENQVSTTFVDLPNARCAKQ